MGVAPLRQHAERLLGANLSPTLRYRCLLIQSADMAILHELSTEIAAVAVDGGSKILTIGAADCFDEQGALSCSDVIDLVEAKAPDHCLILLAPLSFLDYWSRDVRRTFWEFLAVFTRGPGVILFDSLRDHDFEDTFRVIGKIPGTDIRYLKSRLAALQDRLV